MRESVIKNHNVDIFKSDSQRGKKREMVEGKVGRGPRERRDNFRFQNKETDLLSDR